MRKYKIFLLTILAISSAQTATASVDNAAVLASDSGSELGTWFLASEPGVAEAVEVQPAVQVADYVQLGGSCQAAYQQYLRCLAMGYSLCAYWCPKQQAPQQQPGRPIQNKRFEERYSR